MGKTSLARILSRDYKRLMIIDPLSEYADTVFTPTAYDALIYLKNNPNFRISTEDNDDLDNFLKLVWSTENLCLHIEEIDMFADSRVMPFDLGNIIKRGRHRNISLICTSRRPAEVNRLLTSQASDIYIFNTTEPKDCQYIESYTSSELKDTIQNLEKLTFIHYSDQGISKGSIHGFKEIVYER